MVIGCQRAETAGEIQPNVSADCNKVINSNSAVNPWGVLSRYTCKAGPGEDAPPPHEAALTRWLDAYTANVDRTWANPNLLVWHRDLWLIDHGAALYFHFGWPRRSPDPQRYAAQPFDASGHVLADVGPPAGTVHDEAVAALTPEALSAIVDTVPEEWLETTDWLHDTDAVRAAYLDHLAARLANPTAWLS